MSIPCGIWAVINCPWGGLVFSGLPVPNPLADHVLYYPVADKEGEYAGEGENPPKDCLWHASSFSDLVANIVLFHLIP